MKLFHLAYWTKKPYSVLLKESKKFRNIAECYRYILEKEGIPIVVSENSYIIESIKSLS